VPGHALIDLVNSVLHLEDGKIAERLPADARRRPPTHGDARPAACDWGCGPPPQI